MSKQRVADRPPPDYYYVVNASRRWFSTGILLTILTIWSTIPTEWSSWVWLLVALIGIGAVACFIGFVYLAGRSGEIWRRSHMSTATTPPNTASGSVRDFMSGHPILTGNLILVVVLAVIILIAIHR